MKTDSKFKIAANRRRQIVSAVCLSIFLFLGLPPAEAQSGALPILFSSQRESRNGHGTRKIFGMNLDGSNQTRIADTSTISDFFARYSLDGSRIAFTRVVVDAAGFRQQIFVMNADGSNQVNLSNNLNHNNTPAWSPDGTRIAYFRCAPNFTNCDIWMMNADGSDQHLVYGTAGFDFYPTFSPDGSRIAFSGDGDGDNEIYVVNVDGTNPQQITDNDSEDYAPDWSPDGAKIVFARSPNKIMLYASDIYTIAPDGSNETRLTKTGPDKFYPIWSPDGSQILFSMSFGINTDIFLMNADGSDITRLTFGIGEDLASDWLPTAARFKNN